MGDNNQIQVELEEYQENSFDGEKSDQIIFDFDSQIDLYSSNLDMLDYVISISGGILSGLIDVFWVGELNLEHGQKIARKEIDKLVTEVAKKTGYKGNDFSAAVRHLESKFPIPSDKLTPRFGGGLQHHLRDFAHHPTIVGLIFSLLTQFTYKSYGTDEFGSFIIVEIPEDSLTLIGKDTPSKLLFGVIYWFFHLVSDMAGSSLTTMKSGGTGIPGPILSLAKELSVLPIFKNLKVEDKTLSVFISKLFNGTLLAQHDASGKIIKDTQLRFDLRTEIGLGIELGKMAIPVMVNEGIVRLFYFFRRLAVEIKDKEVSTIADFKKIDWNYVKPINNPTLARMLTISTGVFTAIDISDATINKKGIFSVNVLGVGRFAIAVGQDVTWCLKARNVKKAKKIYKEIQEVSLIRNKTLMINFDYLNIEKFSLNIEQTEILYNLEYYKTLNDISNTKQTKSNEKAIKLKNDWLDEWKEFITRGFPSFTQQETEINWLTEQELLIRIQDNNPQKEWFRLVIIESIIFEPYFPLSVEVNLKGKSVISSKYKELQKLNNKFDKSEGDKYLSSLFTDKYFNNNFVKRSRNSYDKYLFDLNQVMLKIVKNITIPGAVSVATMIITSFFVPTIAVFLVGSNFIGLSGAALTSASLAYLGGGAIAAGGFGMAGGALTIIGGGAVLGIGVGSGINGVLESEEQIVKQNLILQSAKLLVSLKEIFLSDENDLEYVYIVLNQYMLRMKELERNIHELNLEIKYNSEVNKKEYNSKILNYEESLEVMRKTSKQIIYLMKPKKSKKSSKVN